MTITIEQIIIVVLLGLAIYDTIAYGMLEAKLAESEMKLTQLQSALRKAKPSD